MRTLFFFISIGFLFSSFGQTEKTWSLQKCVEYALENNITILQNQVQGEIIDNNLTQAKMSRLPSLNGSGSHNYNNGRTIDPFSNSFIERTIQSNSFSLNAGVLLYGGSQINNSIKQTKVSKLANDKGTEVLRNQIALSVASTYLQIIQAEENLKIAKRQEELTENQLKRAEILVESGTTNQGTTLNLQAQLANDKVQSINAENQIQMAYNAMLNLLQLDTETPFEIAMISIDELPTMPMESVAELYEISLNNLPEIKQAELTITQSQIGEKIATSGLLP
ncbi:MAG: TolC family protein, partial [Bacteroidia bacterium]|nr:TolC family protein [Bacteroidia bacterium]